MNKQIEIDIAIEQMASAVREITTACGKCEYYKDGSCLKPIDLGCDTNEDILNSCDAIYSKGFRNARDVFDDIAVRLCGDGFHYFIAQSIFDEIRKKYESEGADGEKV